MLLYSIACMYIGLCALSMHQKMFVRFRQQKRMRVWYVHVRTTTYVAWRHINIQTDKNRPTKAYQKTGRNQTNTSIVYIHCKTCRRKSTL